VDESENIEIERLENPETYLRANVEHIIQHEKAKTANVLAVTLVVGLLGSLPIYALLVCVFPAASEKLAAVFDKWLTIVSPLIGTAIGAYYGSRSDTKQGQTGPSK